MRSNHQCAQITQNRGIKALAKYMHDRGLKLGIYADAGIVTCAGYPGSENYVDIDAQTFADWDVDMLKFDGCSVLDEAKAGLTYMAMTKALNRTGKPIVYSCEWPLYQSQSNLPINYETVVATCNLFRNYDDIEDEFSSITKTLDFYVQHQADFVPHQGPGAFFDPDMLVIGNFGLSIDQSRLQMALWAIWGSPLFMSNDLAHVRPEFKEILQNKDVIALNQDPEGLMGMQIAQVDGVQVFNRPVLPKIKDSYSFGLAFVYITQGGDEKRVTVEAQSLGLNDARGYQIVDLFNNFNMGTLRPNDNLTVAVNPSGATLLKATLSGA